MAGRQTATVPAATSGPPDTIHPVRRWLRTTLSRVVAWVFCRAIFRPRLVDRDHLPGRPAIYCFNHLSWIDPFVLMATLPFRPRLMFFGPKEEDMGAGGRNRLMAWTGATIPYRPGKNDLLDATRRVQARSPPGGWSRSRGRAGSSRSRRTSGRSARARRTSRCASACRSSRSRSAGRRGWGSDAASGSGSASRSRRGPAQPRGRRRAHRALPAALGAMVATQPEPGGRDRSAAG